MNQEEWKIAVLECLLRGIDPEDIVKAGKRRVYGGRK